MKYNATNAYGDECIESLLQLMLGPFQIPYYCENGRMEELFGGVL